MPRRSAFSSRLAVAAVLALALVGCGSGPDDASGEPVATGVGPQPGPSGELAPASPPAPTSGPATPEATGPTAGPTVEPTATPTASRTAGPRPTATPSVSAAQWLRRARTAAEAAGSYQVRGDTDVGGSQVSISLSVAWDRAQGSVTIDGRKSKLTRIGDTVYLKPDPEFLPLLDIDKSKAKSLEKKWVSAPLGDERLPTVLALMDPETSLSVRSPRIAGQQDVRARPTIVISGDDASSSLFVALSGKPLPQAIAPPGAQTPVTVYNYGTKGVTAEAPKGSKVVRLSSL